MSSGSFGERFVEADGFRIRCLEAGEGEPIVHLHGGGGLHVTKAHELLAERFHFVGFEVPGFGRSQENTRTQSMRDLAGTMAEAIAAAGLDTYTLFGTSFGAILALWIALEHRERVAALALEAPFAFRPDDRPPPSDPSDVLAALFVHPERAPATGPPEIVQKQMALLQRVVGPPNDPELKARLPEIVAPTLVLFGTRDGIVPPEMGRIYKRLIPNCYYLLVYDAAHGIAYDRPEALAEVVGDFVARQEVFIVDSRSSVINP